MVTALMEKSHFRHKTSDVPECVAGVAEAGV